MTIKYGGTLDDASKEAGLAQARVAYNAAIAVANAQLPHDPDTDEVIGTPQPTIDTDEDYANMIAAASFDAFKGADKRAIAAKLEQVKDPAAIAAIGALVDQKVAEEPAAVAAEAEVAAEVKA